MNAAEPAPGLRLCALADIPDPGGKGFLFREGDQIFLGFVVRRGGVVRGFVDRCPHTGTPLAAMSRHMIGLFHGQPGARAWRRILTVEGSRAGACVEVVAAALKEVRRASARTPALELA